MFRKVSCKKRDGTWHPFPLIIAKWAHENTRFFDLWLNRTDGTGLRNWLPRHSVIAGVTGLIGLLAMTNGPRFLTFRGGMTWLVAILAIALLTVVLQVAARRADRSAAPLWKNGLDGPFRWLPLLPWLVWATWVLIGAFVDLPIFSFVAYGLLALGILCGLLGAAATPRGLPSILGWLVFVAAAGVIWILADPATTEYVDDKPYRHIMAPLGAFLLFFALPFARWWAWFVFRKRRMDFRDAYSGLLNQTQLFDPNFPSNATRGEILRGLVLAVINTPFQLVLIPSFAIVIAPVHQINTYAVVGFFISWWFMAMVVFHPRLDSLLEIINRLFIDGGSLLVSVIVLAFAAARLAGVEYVTTVLDATSGTALIQYLFLFYVLSWIYDYWTTRSMIEVMMGFLDKTDDHPVKIEYKHRQEKYPGKKMWIQPHGGTRLAVIRDMGRDQKYPYHFNFFRPASIFREIAARSKTSSKARRRIQILESYIRFFHACPAVIFFVVFFWCFQDQMGNPRNYHIRGYTNPPPAANAFSLGRAHEAIRAHPDEKSIDPPMYFVAASGGGTRAAIHTMTVLRALGDRGVLHRVAGISSVSGGSLGNALFAHHRPELISVDMRTREDTWAKFEAAVKDRHIQYVLNGAFEWRLIEGDRFGTILKESFERHINGERSTLGSCKDIAIIFNTALRGEAESSLTKSSDTDGANAGTRIVFTNIPSFTGSNTKDADPSYAADLRYVSFGDSSISIPAMASASANFPPVFSNLAIDEHAGTPRYWVTDGGAMDNRGLISLLLALRSMIEVWGESKTREPATLPPFRILVADASAYSAGFSQDRGIGAATGAKLKVANKLIASLLKDVRRTYGEAMGTEGAEERVTIHDLTLPKAIRSGMGTHWMMPTMTTLKRSKWIPGVKDKSEAVIPESGIIPLFETVFAGGKRTWPEGFDSSWIEGDDPRVALDKLLEADPPG